MAYRIKVLLIKPIQVLMSPKLPLPPHKQNLRAPAIMTWEAGDTLGGILIKHMA